MISNADCLIVTPVVKKNNNYKEIPTKQFLNRFDNYLNNCYFG